jgi:glycosyltransferase involved in cell wall biosynthesis
MRILYLNPTGAIGGAERAMLDGIAMVREHNPSWELMLIAGSDGDLLTEARVLGVKCMALSYPPQLATLGEREFDQVSWTSRLRRLGAALPALARYTESLAHLVDKLRPDLIHSNGIKMHLLVARVTPPACALVWHLHDFLSLRPLSARLLRRYAARCTRIIANSYSVAHDAAAMLGATARIEVVYNGVDLERFRPDGPCAELDLSAGLTTAPAGVIRAGLIATGARWKGHELFLDAFAQLPPELAIRGFIVGGPIYATERSQYTLSELREMIERRGLAQRVGLIGYRRDIEGVMRALDLVVHASVEPEPFGLVIAEAMACARAVVSTAQGGAAELIDAGRNALSCGPRNPTALAAALTLLAKDHLLREKLGAAARDTAEQRFDRRRLGAELSALYRAAHQSISRGERAAPACA